ncbi:MAG: sporulation integral membrane protein YtvI [Lachnospiraceae bacterium]|nr:sporulation integral membrane protein YtvI [Lachnospiraceae bacterium]
MESMMKYVKVVLNIAIPLAWIGFICLVGPKLIGFFMPFVVGWLIAMIANPLVRFLERRLKIVRKHSSALIIVVVLAGVIGLGYFLVTRLAAQAVGLAKELPEVYAAASQEIELFFERFDHIFWMLPENVRQAWSEFTGNVGQTISLLVQKIASPTVEAAGTMAKGIPAVLVNVAVTILSSYFFLAEREQILAFWRKYLPEGGERYYRFLKGDVKKLVGGYFLAQFKIMFVVAAILLAGFLILGVRYAFLMAILIAVLDFLPLFGTGTVLIPWAAVKLLSGQYMQALGMASLYVLSQVVRQMVQPKIVGDSLGLPPLYTLLFLYLGFKLKGISGMILAVPLGILAIKLYEYGAFDSLIENLQILIHDVNKFRRGAEDKK